MAEWGNYSEVLANGNWDKVFVLLPQNLSDEPISQREEALLTFFQEIAGGISKDFEYFNAFLQRVVVYLFNPITKQGANVHQVCHSLFSYFRCLIDSNNPIVLDYEAILERLLEFTKEDYIGEEEVGESIFTAMMMLFSTGRLDDPKYLNIRKRVLGEFLAIVQAGRLPQTALDGLLGPGMLITGNDEDLVEIIFGCEKFMKIVLARMTKKANVHLLVVFLSCCCKVCPKRGLEFFMKNNIMQSVIVLLKSFQEEDFEHFESFDDILEALEQLLMQAESLVDENETLYNPIALQIEAKRGLKILKELENSENHASPVAKRINSSYFGEGLENYLARKRGLKTKRAK